MCMNYLEQGTMELDLYYDSNLDCLNFIRAFNMEIGQSPEEMGRAHLGANTTGDSSRQ